MSIEELAQKLYNDDGYAGNVYKTEPCVLRSYENKALKIQEEN